MALRGLARLLRHERPLACAPGVLNDRTNAWACDPENWPRGLRRGPMPDASTLSRRMRTKTIDRLIDRLRRRLDPAGEAELVAVIDGKPLPIGPHSHDKQAGRGRGASGMATGYKPHTLMTLTGRVIDWRLAPMNVDEREMARRIMKKTDHRGDVLGDANDDANRLHDTAIGNGMQLVAPRRYGPDKGLGHHRHSPGRLRSKELIEHEPGPFVRELMRHRPSIERNFGTLTSLPRGLGYLPAWVRGWRRVRNWVAAKLVINAARSARRREALMQ